MAINTIKRPSPELIVSGVKRFFDRVWEKFLSIVWVSSFSNDSIEKTNQVFQKFQKNQSTESENLVAQIVNDTASILDKKIKAKSIVLLDESKSERSDTHEYIRELSKHVRLVASRVFTNSLPDQVRSSLNLSANKKILEKAIERETAKLESLQASPHFLKDTDIKIIKQYVESYEADKAEIEQKHQADKDAHSSCESGLSGTAQTDDDISREKSKLEDAMHIALGRDLLHGTRCTDATAKKRGESAIEALHEHHETRRQMLLIQEALVLLKTQRKILQ